MNSFVLPPYGEWRGFPRQGHARGYGEVGESSSVDGGPPSTH